MSSDKYTVADEAQDIVKEVVSRVFMPESTYNHSRVPQLVNQIVESTVQKLQQQQRIPRKYIVHCVIVQKNGAGVHTMSACYWDTNTDGCFAYKAESKVMICIVTVYRVSL